MFGDEWVFFNAAQVLPCYVIQLYDSKKARRDKLPAHPPPLAAGLLQRHGVDDESVFQKERERKRKDRLLARVSARARLRAPPPIPPPLHLASTV